MVDDHQMVATQHVTMLRDAVEQMLSEIETDDQA
jgi:hypothetical protein